MSFVEYNFSNPSVNVFLLVSIYLYLYYRTSLKSSNWSKNVLGVTSTFLRSSLKYYSHKFKHEILAFLQKLTKISLCFSDSIGILAMYFLPTVVKASSLQLLNQSIVQQLIKLGNLRARTRRLLPAGLIHKMIWRCDLMHEMKYDHKD